MNKRQTIQKCLERAIQVSQQTKFNTGEIMRELQPIIDMHKERERKQQSPQQPNPPQDIMDFFNKNVYKG